MKDIIAFLACFGGVAVILWIYGLDPLSALLGAAALFVGLFFLLAGLEKIFTLLDDWHA